MKNILSQIWNGEIYPFEECSRTDQRLRELHAISDSYREKLTQGMDAAQIKALEDYEDCLCDQTNYSMEKSFLHGIRLAVGFLTEALH